MPKITAVDSEKPLKCVARRHMRPAMFVTYDAMVAMCKSDEEYEPGEPLIFWASEKKLANMNNRSAQQESEALEALEKSGWIVPLASEQGRWRKGRWTTNKYRVIEHDEYVAAHGDCPPLLYHPKTGEKLKPGQLGQGLKRNWVHKVTGVQLPDFMADAVAAGKTAVVAEFPELTREQVLAAPIKKK